MDKNSNLLRALGQRQAEFIQAEDEKKKRQDEVEAQLWAKNEDEIKRRVSCHLIDQDQITINDIARVVANGLAKESANPNLPIDWQFHGDIIEQSVEKVLKADFVANAQRYEAANSQTSNEPTSQQQPETDKTSAPSLIAGPNRPDDYDPSVKQLTDNAVELRKAEDVEAASWVNQAETPERLRMQRGRYDDLRGFDLPPDGPPLPPTSSIDPEGPEGSPHLSHTPPASTTPADNSTEAFIALISANTSAQEPSVENQTRDIIQMMEAEQPEADPSRERHDADLMKDFMRSERVEKGGAQERQRETDRQSERDSGMSM